MKMPKLSAVSHVPKLSAKAALELKCCVPYRGGYVPSSVNLRPQCCEMCVTVVKFSIFCAPNNYVFRNYQLVFEISDKITFVLIYFLAKFCQFVLEM